MQYNQLPLARHLFAAPRKFISSALVLGALSLGLAPEVCAQLRFSVDSFTSSAISVTISGDSLLQGTTPPANADQLRIYRAAPFTNDTTWISANSETAFLTGQLGATFLHGRTAVSDAGGDYLVIDGYGNFVSGSSFSTPGVFLFTFVFTGVFDPPTNQTLSLYWGTSTTGVLQSTSAIPEPSTYASLVGICALFFSAHRRRSHGAKKG